jgi:hypothetical protein
MCPRSHGLGRSFRASKQYSPLSNVSFILGREKKLLPDTSARQSYDAQDMVQIQLDVAKSRSLQPTPLQSLVHHKARRQRQHVAARPNAHPILPPLDHPAVDPIIPVGHRDLVERQHHARTGAGREVPRLAERAKQARRVGHVGRLGHRHIQLYDLGAGDRAGVGHRDRGRQTEIAVGDGRPGQVEIGQGKRGV